MSTTYTVIDQHSGEVIARGQTVAQAAEIILTDDSAEFRIEADKDGFTLWTRKQVANKPWTQTVIFSVERDREKAEAEIFQKVIKAGWDRHPEVMTDADYDAMIAESGCCVGPDERAEYYDTDPRDEWAAEQEYCDRAAGRASS